MITTEKHLYYGMVIICGIFSPERAAQGDLPHLYIFSNGVGGAKPEQGLFIRIIIYNIYNPSYNPSFLLRNIYLCESVVHYL